MSDVNFSKFLLTLGCGVTLLASVQVFAKNNLTATVKGFGNITYYGSPKSVTKAVKGLGHIGAK